MAQNPFYSDIMARDMTIETAIAEIERELRIRKRVYARLVADEGLTLAKAIEQYTALRVALDYLVRVNQQVLF